MFKLIEKITSIPPAKDKKINLFVMLEPFNRRRGEG